MDEEITAGLELYSISRSLGGGCVAHGLIFKDTRRRWPDGKLIRTSEIILYDAVAGLLHTRNSIYKIIPTEKIDGEQSI